VASAATLNVSVGGTDWTMTTVFGTFDDLEATLPAGEKLREQVW